jgi:hypothetical protein
VRPADGIEGDLTHLEVSFRDIDTGLAPIEIFDVRRQYHTEFILGLDFLRASRAPVDLKRLKLLLRKVEVPLQHSGARQCSSRIGGEQRITSGSV